MANLKKLSKTIQKKKNQQKVDAVEQPSIIDRLVGAIERIQQPIINMPAREPASYKMTIDLNSRGDPVSATFRPIQD